MASYSLITAPATEPLTLAEAKLHLNIPTAETYHDTLITSLITSARMTIEQSIYRGLITQTWEKVYDADEFGSYVVNISKVPVQSITSVKYYDSNNNLVTMDSSNYRVDLGAINAPARIQFLSLPSVYDRIGAVQIRFVCGWTSAANVPEPIKSAMKLIIGHLYEHREDVMVAGNPSQLPNGSEYLLKHYSISWFYENI